MNTSKNRIIITSAIFLIVGLACVGYLFLRNTEEKPVNIPFLKTNSHWVDSLMKVISLDEKIGMLFLYDAGRISEKNMPELRAMLVRKQFGGIVFSSDSLKQQTVFTNELQKTAKFPLFVGLQSPNFSPVFLADITPLVNAFPLLAIADDSLLQEHAAMALKLNKLLGVNFIFSPDFSDKKYISADSLWLKFIAGKNASFIRECEKTRIVSCAIGFSQATDTAMQKSMNAAYKQIIQNGVLGFCFNSNSQIQQKRSVQNILNFISNNLHFDGLVVRKIDAQFKNVEDEIIAAFSSEADLIFTNYELGTIIGRITKLFLDKKLDIGILDKKVRRILLAKSWVGLEKIKPVVVDSIKELVNSIHYKSLRRRLNAASLILLKNDRGIIPIKEINQNFTVYSFLENDFIPFSKQFELYADCEQITIADIPEFVEEMNTRNGVSIILFDSISSSVKTDFISCIEKIEDKSKLIFVNFGKEQTLMPFVKLPIILQCHNKSNDMQSLAVQLIFGGISAKGKLPLTLCPEIKFNAGIIYTPVTRLSYTIPEEAGIDAEMLTEIDDIALEAIAEHGTPGCQVFVAKDGKVIYNKSFGTHRFDRNEPVEWNNLYDIASVTKVAATTLAVMKMYDDKKLSLDAKIGKYFIDTSINYTRIKPDTLIRIDTFTVSEIRKNKKLIEDKDTVYIDDSTLVAYDTIISKVTPRLNIFQTDLQGLMIHKSGLPPSMPVLRYVQYRKDKIFLNEKPLKNRKDSALYLFNKFYSRKFIKDSAEHQIADLFYLRKPYVDTLWNDIKQIRVYTKSVYMYSDVNMNLVQKVVDSINDFGIDEYLEKNFYTPMGLRHTCYKPLDRFDKKYIIPTSEDKFWREQYLQGHVHDPAAAMLGGVAGNAGLFSCANDLGVMFQMLLNKGEYGGQRFIDSATVKKFTMQQPDSYRGLGFDLASLKGINAPDAPSETFGHTGFTGTCVWADPKNKLVYVFLSNRVCPSEKNWKLNSLEVRQKIHQVVYDAMKNSKGCP